MNYNALFLLVAFIALGCGGVDKQQAESKSTPQEKSTDVVVATVGDQSIMMSDLDKATVAAQKQAKMAFDQQINQIRQGALKGLTEKKLVEMELTARKLENIEALVKLEIVDKTEMPTAKDVAEFYLENKEEIGDTPLELVKDRIIQYLTSEARERRSEAFVSELRTKYPVKDLLPVYRLDVGQHGPSKGPKDARVTIIEYADFECPFCSDTAKTVLAIQKKYPKDVRVVFRHFPLSFHENAMPAAVATRCAQYQNKFWAMHDEMFARSESLNEAEIIKAAGDVGLDVALFKTCLESDKETAAVQAEMDEGSALGVEGTPAFFVNGIPLGGAQPFEAFEELVKSELNR
jgi:protein-disulfide isomerase